MSDPRNAPSASSLAGEPMPSAAVSPVSQRLAIVVPSTAAYDSRTVRIAASAASRGHEVTVFARAGADAPAGVLERDGYRIVRAAVGTAPRLPLPLRVVDRAMATRRHARAAAKVDAGADLYHAMAFMGLPVALELGRRHRAPVVYDARDLYADARGLARLPAPARSMMRARERRWAHRASRVVTVNEGLADVLAERLRVERPVIVRNCAPRPMEAMDAAAPPSRLHDALRLPPATRIVLYHGAFDADRGIEQLLEAASSLPPDAKVVLLGYGPMRGAFARRIGADDILRVRVRILDAVLPPELGAWVASADVAVVAIQPTTLNHRLATPNKLYEALAAGVPVVASDFPAMRAIVADDPDGPLGELCDPTDPSAIATAVRRLLDLPPTEMADLRARCLRAATARYAWETQLDVLLALYAQLTGRPW